jgi:hypothetical protein
MREGGHEMKLLDRFRRLWRTGTGPDHPLTAEERDELRSKTAYDEDAETFERYVGGSFDPDDDRGGRRS